MPFASRDGVRLYWRVEGEPHKPTILLLNSIGSDMSLWDRVVPMLLQRLRVLRMDTRGHGASDAPAGDYALEALAADALAVMDAAGVERVAICGLSLGGMIAMTLALAAPARVSALVLACTSAQMDPAIWRARVGAVRAGGTAAIADAAMERFFSPAFTRNHPEVLAGVRSTLIGMSADGYAGCAAAIRDMGLTGKISAIAAPTLVISGARDVATPFEGHGERIVAAISDARSSSLNAAHLACMEAPGGFAGLVLGFLADPAAPRDQEALYDAGLKVRRQVLGDAWVDRSIAGRTAFNADFQELITRYAWGEIWGRPGIDHRTRRLLVVAITASLGRWEEFRLHVRAGLEQGGFTEDELREVLMQMAIYAGVPAANTAFAEAATVIRALGEAGL